ncbi:MAG: hypothetical protein ACMG6E_08585, partial [Candidatus Roizmanbacteria bacterium]
PKTPKPHDIISEDDLSRVMYYYYYLYISKYIVTDHLYQYQQYPLLVSSFIFSTGSLIVSPNVKGFMEFNRL